MSIFGTGSGNILNVLSQTLDPGGTIPQVARALGLTSKNIGPGGYPLNRAVSPNINVRYQNSLAPTRDWRVRISLANPDVFDGGKDIQNPVFKQTQGLIFPYTPNVTVTHAARYSEQALTHTNYKSYFYEGSEVQAITINGGFTVQNLEEGQYLLAAIYFLRSATKMFYGKDLAANAPPPLVYLDGYGDFYFPHVSCVITNFSHTMPGDVDYVEIPINAKAQRTLMPTTSNIQVTLQPIYSRKNTFDNFTLEKFSRGELLAGKGGFI